jgi:hypothetical protein
MTLLETAPSLSRYGWRYELGRIIGGTAGARSADGAPGPDRLASGGHRRSPWFIAGMLAVPGALAVCGCRSGSSSGAAFVKRPGPPLEMRARWSWRIIGLLVAMTYILVLGPSLRF